MTETDRIQVTLTKFYVDMIDDCVGILGYNRSQIVNSIVKNYFQVLENQEIITMLKKKYDDIIKKKKMEKAKETSNIDERIEKLFNFANNIELDTFKDYLNIEKEFLFKNLDSWAKKFNFSLENKKIIKNK